MRGPNQFFVVSFKLVYRLFFQFTEVLVVVVDQSGAKIYNFDMKILSKYDVLRFQIAVDDFFRVEVWNDLQDFSKVEKHNFLFLFHQVDVVLDSSHELEDISIRAVVENLRKVGFSLDGLMEFDDTLVVEFPQD